MARDECCARGPRPLPVLGVIDCDGRYREGRGWSELVGSDWWEAGIVTSLMSLFSLSASSTRIIRSFL